LWVDKFHLCQGVQGWIRETDLNLVDLITWDKKKMGMGYRTRRQSEYLVVFQKSPVRAKGIWTSHSIPDVWGEKTEKRHPHSKPVELQKAIIEATTEEGDFVLDPAAGGYSVYEACKATNRIFIGGDIKGDVETEVWETLARTIKGIDQNHLMTFHPFGRTSSVRWFHNAEWLDFNMFQSGHRRYDQTRGDGDDTAQASVAEDNWRYVEEGLALEPQKPILDGEPSYEEIPQGLHDPSEPWWKSHDVRRYAYWSVFAGAFGHTYGHNSIMQMHKGGDKPGGYGAIKSWKEGLQDPGFSQMQYVKKLILRFPFFERVGDQSVIAAENGFRYDRAIATRGEDYLMVYTYTNKPMQIDLTKIAGQKKQIWWMNPSDGTLTAAGELENGIHTFQGEGEQGPTNDRVLIAFDAEKSYIEAGEQAI